MANLVELQNVRAIISTLSYVCKESVKFYYMLVAMFNFGTVGQKRKFEKWRRNNLSKKWI